MTLEEGTSTSTDIHDVKQSLNTQTDTSISIEEEEPSSLDDSFNTAAEARRNNQPMGTKPKQSNLSLLSSAVAHATLERCLLGRNGGETVDEKESSSTSTDGSKTINYSKQCKEGKISGRMLLCVLFIDISYKVFKFCSQYCSNDMHKTVNIVSYF